MSPPAHPRSEGSGRDSKLKRLLIRPGAIGDVIVSLPALEHLKTGCTEVWTSAPCVPLLRFADRVRSISSTGLDLLELGLDSRAHEALEEFDSIVSWYGASRPEFRQAVRDLPFTFHVALPQEPGVHAADFYMRQAGGPDGAVPMLPFSAPKRTFIAIHPFSGSARKNWPMECYRDLAKMLPLPVEFSAGPEEELPEARRFGPLDEQANWLASARLYIGNDSGITHLAAAVGTPVVAIFRASDPAVWAPRGTSPVRIPPGDPLPDEVARFAKELLRQPEVVCRIFCKNPSGHES